MKVLKNNFNEPLNEINEVIYKFEPYPRSITCEECGSELEYDKSDMRMGMYGCNFIDCPLCGYDNMLEDNEYNIALTKDNVQFPVHFHHSSKETGAKDICNNTHIKECIKEAIEYFRTDKNEFVYLTSAGNTSVFVFKFDDDEDYEVFVCPDFYTTYIPFEQEDYGGNNGRGEIYKLCESEW